MTDKSLKHLPHLGWRPLFNGDVFACFTEDDWHRTPMWKTHREAFLGDGTAARCSQYSDGDVVIRIDPSKASDFDDLADTLAHEAVHAAHRLVAGIGDKDPSEEHLARLTGVITGFLMREYLKKRSAHD